MVIYVPYGVLLSQIVPAITSNGGRMVQTSIYEYRNAVNEHQDFDFYWRAPNDDHEIICPSGHGHALQHNELKTFYNALPNHERRLVQEFSELRKILSPIPVDPVYWEDCPLADKDL
jgi:hypothetical protein